MDSLNSQDLQTLQSVLNSEIHRMKLRKFELEQRFKDEDCTKQQFDTGKEALSKRIKYIHNLKTKLGCDSDLRKST